MLLARLCFLPFVVGVLLVMTGCEGPVGPEGPPGQDGVGLGVNSDEVDFSVEDALINGSVASIGYDASVITQNVVDNGIVLAYFREHDTWTAMPYTYGVENPDPDLDAVDYTVTFGYAYEQNFLELFYEASLENEELLRSLPDRRVKIVVVDALPAARQAVDLSDYSAVKAYYGLED